MHQVLAADVGCWLCPAADDSVISKCKNLIGKVPAPLPIRRPSPAPYFHTLIKILQIPPPPSPREVI